jgi:4-amino-4-deoxy-L-arabinose transferase-like glycosyltransferase
MDPTAKQPDTAESAQGSSPAEASPVEPASVGAAPVAARSEGRSWLLLLAAALTLGSLFGPIAASGIWDPHELRVADLARRIALNLLGAGELALEGGVNSVPTLGDLARGQLPFTSVALGFKFFGLHAWAGRLPLALWGLVGVLASYALVSRLADRAAGAITAIVLSTMPLYFLHSRTLLGDIVTMASFALATAGLALACFDRVRPGEDARAIQSRRVLWLIAGFSGLAAGFGARGALIGIAVPALGVAIAWLIARPLTQDRLGDVAGGLALAAAVAALALGVPALLRVQQEPTAFSMLVGAGVKRAPALPTYDFVVQYLGHGLFPWSAVIPFAIGRTLGVPPAAAPAELSRQAGLRLSLLSVATLCFAAYGLMAPLTGHLPFAAVFALAACVALALRDFERGAPGSRALGMGVAALTILLFYDFQNFPEKALSAFAVDDARFPESFKETGTRILKYGALAMSGLFLLSFMEQQGDASRRFDRNEYLAWPRQLRTLYSGNLMFGLLVAETALLGLAVLSFLSERRLQLPSFMEMGAVVKQAAQYGFVLLPVLVLGVPLGALFARDVVRELYARLPISRGIGALLSVAAFGAVLSFVYYPALAAQISPKEVYESYRQLARSGELLGMLGVSTGSASYYAGRDVPTFGDAPGAFEWLMTGPQRRWLVIRADDLPQMNSLYRARTNPPKNLPVLDARSSEILLISSALAGSDVNENPFDAWILSKAPAPSHKVDGNFGGQLDTLGWDVTTPDGTVVDSVAAGKPYQFKIYYRVVASISGTWETFIHIDGFQRRFNGDHKTLEGKYPFHLLRVGDHVVDVYSFTLEPNFTPGTYNVFYGLFTGSRRLEVKRGAAQEDRLNAGTLRVR